MKIVESIQDVRAEIGAARQSGKTIGCVPTMGALHAGHLSLIRAAREQSDYVVVTIFVNPTQFGPNEDLDRYPRPFENDAALCEETGADLIFHPAVNEMYDDEAQVRVVVGELANRWEGAHRSGHFDGVATVVTKLFNICQPDKAFFGRKDYQQQCIIRAMCRDLDLPVEIVTCPTIREQSGLAMSSRNAYLSDEEREVAYSISAALLELQKQYEKSVPFEQLRNHFHQKLEQTPGLILDYAAIVEPVKLTEVHERRDHLVAIVAANVGKTRLIDNIELFEEPHRR